MAKGLPVATGTATFVRRVDWPGDARLYRLDPPLDQVFGRPVTHVIVTARVAPFKQAPETCAFAADELGIVRHWADLQEFWRGDLDHAAALAQGGYAVEGGEA